MGSLPRWRASPASWHLTRVRPTGGSPGEAGSGCMPAMQGSTGWCGGLQPPGASDHCSLPTSALPCPPPLCPSRRVHHRPVFRHRRRHDHVLSIGPAMVACAGLHRHHHFVALLLCLHLTPAMPCPHYLVPNMNSLLSCTTCPAEYDLRHKRRRVQPMQTSCDR